jgi:hypothetical protein
MARIRVPEIPPVPTRRSGRGAEGSRLTLAQTAPPKRSEEAELPDLLEAFWGDKASAPDDRDRPVPAAANVRRVTPKAGQAALPAPYIRVAPHHSAPDRCGVTENAA